MKVQHMLLFLLIVGGVHASYYINQISINFYVEENGDAQAEEVYNIVITGQVDIGNYIAHMEEGDIVKWRELLGDEEVRIHVNPLYVGVKDVEVLAQPPRAPQGRGDNVVTSATLIIRYKVVPKAKGEPSLFYVSQVRPRLYKYELNTKALSLKTSALGNFVLDERTSLIFYLPPRARVEEVNPQPYEMDEDFVKWRNTVLVKPKLVFLREISIQEEIADYIEKTSSSIITFLSTKEGKVVALLSLIILSFYIYLRLKVRG